MIFFALHSGVLQIIDGLAFREEARLIEHATVVHTTAQNQNFLLCLDTCGLLLLGLVGWR